MIAQPIQVTYLAADLQVASVSAPTTATAGGSVSVRWTVSNAGQAATSETLWQDGVYLSTDSDFQPASDVELGLVPRQGALDSGASYTQTSSFTLRQDLEGPYYVYVVTDARRQAYEHTFESNNTGSAARLLEVTGVHADLQVTAIAAPAGGTTGAPVTVTWTVANAGRDATAATSWSDAVYLSSDNILDAGDQLLATVPHDGALAAGASYQVTRAVTLLGDTVGAQFLLVKTDSAAVNQVYEYDAEGNNTASRAIAISYAPAPDLRVASIVAPVTAWSGQSIHLAWTATNAGSAVASTSLGNWYDAVYLSRDPYVDIGADVYLGAISYAGTLAAGASYAAPQTIDARLPAGISGPYYVLVVTDSNNRVQERSGEANNLGVSAAVVQVNLTPPCDLQVTAIAPPAPTAYGQPALWTYEVTNRDTLDAYGAWYDTLYLSADNVWDIDDPRIARVLHTGDVPHAEAYTGSVTANVPGVLPGAYYVIVRTDILNEVRELDDNNNTGASVGRFTVLGRELTLEEPAAGTLPGGQSIFYQVTVGPNEDLLISLSGAAASSAELLIGLNHMPSRAQYDFRAAGRTAADSPQIRIPGTAAGTYFIQVYGNRTGAAQPYSLVAELLDSAVSTVSPNAGGNTGRVTVFIGGSHLPQEPVVSLAWASLTARLASEVWPGDSAGFYATFDLTGLAPGAYDVRVEDPGAPGAAIVANDVFTVQAGGAPNLEASLNIPAVVRPGAPFTISVEYGNSGTVDLVAPLLKVAGPAGLLFGTSADATIYSGSITFLGASRTGPAGILQPGETETIQFYCSGVGGGSHDYYLTSMSVDPTEPTPPLIDWAAMEPEYRPPILSAQEWAPVWQTFTREAGATWPEVISHLAAWANATPNLTLEDLIASRLMQQEFLRVTAPNGGGLTDVTPPSILTHMPVYAAAQTVSGLDLIFSEAVGTGSFTACGGRGPPKINRVRRPRVCDAGIPGLPNNVNRIRRLDGQGRQFHVGLKRATSRAVISVASRSRRAWCMDRPLPRAACRRG